jgi:hypothetical protein
MHCFLFADIRLYFSLFLVSISLVVGNVGSPHPVLEHVEAEGDNLGDIEVAPRWPLQFFEAAIGYAL